MNSLYRYSVAPPHKPNIFDLLALIIIVSVLGLLGWSASTLSTPYDIYDPSSVILSSSHLPYYALRTVLRMLFAMLVSLLATFSIGSLMAKNKHYRDILLPIIDILQSIPPLGVNAFIILTCIRLFPGSMLGLELASIITTFFAQVWNMILSFYQSLVTIPRELYEVSDMFHLTPWQRFWRLEVPKATPGLILNSMMSMSASWFFVVASESLFIADQQIVLPGIGSFIAQSVLKQDLYAIGLACLAMFLVILIYDQIIFRPLLTWSEKFKEEIEEDEVYQDSWFFDLLSKAHFLQSSIEYTIEVVFSFIAKSVTRSPSILPSRSERSLKKFFKIVTVFLESCLAIGSSLIFIKIVWHFYTIFSIYDWLKAFQLGSVTALKVLAMVFLSACIWVPVGVWIGSHPRLASRFQPVIQFLAACPPQMFYPFFASLIVDYRLNVEIWTAPIMILGTQWYILFNVIAGTLMITKDQRLAAANFGLKSWLLWKRLYLPAVLPYCITGCMAAAGGCWNVSIDSDTIVWGSQQLQSIGISSYIHNAFSHGDFDRAILGIIVMTTYVVVINRFLWTPLFQKVSSYYN